MSEFLTDAWFARLDETASRAQPSETLRLSIEQVITAEAERRWQVVIADGRVRIEHDPSADADVRITTDLATASGIHAGEISAQRAFLDGRLRIGGDVQALMDHREVLAELGLGLA